MRKEEPVVKPHRQYYWHVPIPYEAFMELSEHMNAIRSRDEIGDLAGAAIRFWLADEKRKQQVLPTLAPSLVNGYQWKRLFLPDGTLLRTIFKGRPRVAQVADSQLVFEGATTTPNAFVNSTGGAPRNAWKAIWLLFPGEREWKPAEDCRPSRLVKAAIQPVAT
jgi:hypothetical protein